MGAARKALWYIESHFAENPSLAQIAEAVQLSPFHLSRLFQVVPEPQWRATCVRVA